MSKEKELVGGPSEHLWIYELDGLTRVGAKRYIDDVFDDFSNKYPKAISPQLEVYEDYDATSMYIRSKRYETDKELKARLKEEAKEAERKRLAKEKKLEKARKLLEEQEESEREQYERLKAKFEVMEKL